MSEIQIVMPSDVTLESLEALFSDAYMDVHTDEDGDLYVQEPYKIWIEPRNEGRRVRFLAVFGVGQTSTILDQLEYVNQVNNDLVLIRASLSGPKKDTILFSYYFTVEGGVSKRAIVFALKGFASVLEDALRLDIGNVLG